MRILVASVDFPPHRDGVSTMAGQYAQRLTAMGHDVLAVGPAAKDGAAWDAAAGFPVRRFPGYAWGWLRGVPFACVMLAAIRRHRPDVIFAMNVAYGGLLCLVLDRVAGCRYMTMGYGLEFLKFRSVGLMRGLYRRVYERSLLTVAVSRFTAERLAEFGVPADGIHVQYPGVAAVSPGQDTSSGQGDHVGGTGRMVIGTCGRLIRRKGHAAVLRALPAIREKIPGVVYRIAGEGPCRWELESLSRRMGVDGCVEFLGAVPDGPALEQFYRSLDLFVMPAEGDIESGDVEGFGIVYLEAAVRGVPSVATRTGGIPEAIEDGRTGVLVAPGDTAGFIGAVTGLLSDGDRRRGMGAAARDRAVREFAWQRHVDEVWRSVRSAMGGRES